MWREAMGGSTEHQRSDIAATVYAVNTQGSICRCYESLLKLTGDEIFVFLHVNMESGPEMVRGCRRLSRGSTVRYCGDK